MKILVPVDGSASAERALDYAIFLAKACGASLGLIHVVQLPSSWTAPPWRVPAPASYDTVQDQQETYREAIEIIESNGESILTTAEAKTKTAGLPVEKIMQSGHPADVIVRIAGEKGYDLIVMGSRGISGIKEMLLGSVSHHVSQHAKCSVLIAR